MVNNFTYIPNIPDGPNNPSNDQPNMKTNTNSIESIIEIDHVGFNENNGGYHTIIHQIRQSGNPALIPTINQLFSKNYTPDTTGGVADVQLFSANGAGGVVQMTGSAQQQEGFVWCAGLLIQWGTVTTASVGTFASGSASGKVTFRDRAAGAIRFPNNCYFVLPVPFWTTVSTQPNGAGSANINQTTLLPTEFDWKFNSNSANYRGFYWVAIGN